MKKLLIILLLLPLNLLAQDTWFKILPGWRAENSHLKGDTIITVCNGNIGWKNIAVINYSGSDGTFYYSDTLDYSQQTGDSLISTNVSTSFVSIYDSSSDKLKLGLSYDEKINYTYTSRAGLFETNPFKKMPIDFNVDTFYNHTIHYTVINDNEYVISHWGIRMPKMRGTNNFQLFKLQASNFKLIKKIVNTNVGPGSNGHQIHYDKVYRDMIGKSMLFLLTSDNWDYTGGPNSYQDEILKIDTSGNTLWRCRPNNDKCTNSSNLVFIQKPNGNLLCSYNDRELPPNCDSSHNNPYYVGNDSMKIWFAEVDYQSGEVLWRKDINDFIEERMIPNYYPIRIDLLIKDVLFFDNAFYWVGNRRLTVNTRTVWKHAPAILKTDLNGNPLWYRETNMFPSDTGDKGLLVSSFIITPDSGFLLTGEYCNQFGQLSGGELWQKAAILKLDKHGCYVPGCHKSDGIVPISRETDLKIYPNPASNILSIPGFEDIEYEIYNTLGELVQEGYFSNEIDISDLKNGVYILKLTNNMVVFSNKFIKQ